jgi:alkanesulfonate monooxygenase SsuD/methylene tetrahydromethanopterin reductase-like flavin-dependent oxidoreductase (luciferase family)
VRVGVTLPQFREDPAHALAAARAADDQGLDGVFVFDHLWAIGQPDRPALACWPLLGALAATTTRVVLGTLVARVSLLPDAVLAHQFETLAHIVGTKRVVAGLGTGDRLSEPENVAYGIPFPPLDERLARLADCARRTKALGVQTWIGGRSPAVRRVAVDVGADALNLWDATPDEVRDAGKDEGGTTVTWGAVTPDDAETLAALLQRLADAGATWAVCGPSYRSTDRPPQDTVAIVAKAARTLR